MTLQSTPSLLFLLLVVLLSSACLGRFVDPEKECDATDLGLVPADLIRYDGGGFQDSIPWTHSYDETNQCLTIEWNGLCGDECQATETLEFDLSDPDCVTLRLHIIKRKDYYDGKMTANVGTSGFRWQQYIPDSLLAGQNEGARFWIEF